ncbi:hypothetical protein ASG23_08065 [Cellulomonas sp. Leaf395]|jgi:hypothetical protein|nr:hypothetical protein ASG23_08065 [Cellulomonas sp. Leaf395]
MWVVASSMGTENWTKGVEDMTVVDQHHRIEPETEAQVRREVAGASWFKLAAATSKAHHDVDDARRGHDDDALCRALDRHAVLERLLAEATDRLHPPRG